MCLICDEGHWLVAARGFTGRTPNNAAEPIEMGIDGVVDGQKPLHLSTCNAQTANQ